MEPLPFTITITKSPSYIESLMMSVSGILKSLSPPLLELDAAMGIGLSSASKFLFIGSRI